MMDKVDGNCVGKLENEKDNDNYNFGVSALQSEDNENYLYYNMNHKHRGIALIFNHEKFDIPGWTTRRGTNIDRANLAIRLKNLGFYVKVYQDLRYDQIHKEIKLAANEDHSDCDCFLMVVLTHGDPGILYSKNCAYNYECLWKPFFNESCPTLKNKPKLFFIQACQGNAVDHGITLYRTEIDGTPENQFLILTHPDILIAYSTVPGFYSWRRTDEGSWFINALCHEFDQMDENHNLLSLLTFVCQRVALDYESNCVDDAKKHLKKQMPCITSTLTRLLRFTKKGTDW